MVVVVVVVVVVGVVVVVSSLLGQPRRPPGNEIKVCEIALTVKVFFMIHYLAVTSRKTSLWMIVRFLW